MNNTKTNVFKLLQILSLLQKKLLQVNRHHNSSSNTSNNMSQLFGESNDDDDDSDHDDSEEIDYDGSDEYNDDNKIGERNTVNKNTFDHHPNNNARMRKVEVHHLPNPYHSLNNPHPYTHLNTLSTQLGTINIHQQQQSIDHKKKNDIVHDGYLDDMEDEIRSTAAAAIAAAVAAVGEDDPEDGENQNLVDKEKNIINEINRNAKGNINSNFNKTHSNLSDSHQHFMNKNCHY